MITGTGRMTSALCRRGGCPTVPQRPSPPSAPDEEADDALADRRLKSLHGFRGEAHLLKTQGLAASSPKNTPSITTT